LKVSSQHALEELATRFDQKIEPSPRPGGGQRIVIFDPDGKPVELVYGAKRVAEVPTREPLNFNSGGKRSRLGRMPIFENQPVPVLELRHVIMSSRHPQRLIDWLVKDLGAYPSDVIVDDSNVPMMAFLRFPKGVEYVEHHHIGVSVGAQPGAQHICFETIDLDAVFMGHRYLDQRGYKGVWGPARHSLGGGVSDYWRDPSGFIVEHVTDGDYVNAQAPTAYSPANDASTHQWAASPPADSLE
jgi:hypothetical protein